MERCLYWGKYHMEKVPNQFIYGINVLIIIIKMNMIICKQKWRYMEKIMKQMEMDWENLLSKE